MGASGSGDGVASKKGTSGQWEENKNKGQSSSFFLPS